MSKEIKQLADATRLQEDSNLVIGFALLLSTKDKITEKEISDTEVKTRGKNLKSISEVSDEISAPIFFENAN